MTAFNPRWVSWRRCVGWTSCGKAGEFWEKKRGSGHQPSLPFCSLAEGSRSSPGSSSWGFGRAEHPP